MSQGTSRARRRSSLDMVEFQVIGELRHDPHHLLLLGSDGRSYGYDILSGDIRELEPDDSWAVDVAGHTTYRLETHVKDLAS